MKKVYEIMTRFPMTIEPNDSLYEAAKIMESSGVGCLVVQRKTDFEPLGIVTDRDIVVRALARERDPGTTTVSEAMTTPVYTCYSTDNAQDAVQLMEDRRVRRLPVIDRETGKVAGVVSLDDLARKAHREVAGEILKEVAPERKTA